jgi:hypothetical protein
MAGGRRPTLSLQPAPCRSSRAVVAGRSTHCCVHGGGGGRLGGAVHCACAAAPGQFLQLQQHTATKADLSNCADAM